MSKKYLALTTFISLFITFSSAFASEVSNTLSGIVIGVPKSNIISGTYTNTLNIELFSSGADSVHFTLDGNNPTCESGLVYKDKIIISNSTKLKAISCYKDGFISEVSEFNYVINIKSGGTYLGSYPSLVSKNNIKGEVLGESVSSSTCKVLIYNPIVFGKINNINDVKNLQSFLNNELKLSLPITGYYGKMTRNGVILLQNKYHDEILGKDYIGGGTGNVYKMTISHINKMECEKI